MSGGRVCVEGVTREVCMVFVGEVSIGSVGFLEVVRGGRGDFAGDVSDGVVTDGSKLCEDANGVLWNDCWLWSKLLKSRGVAADTLCLSGKMGRETILLIHWRQSCA